MDVATPQGMTPGLLPEAFPALHSLSILQKKMPQVRSGPCQSLLKDLHREKT